MTKEELLKEVEKEQAWLAEAGYDTYNVDVAFTSICRKIRQLEPDEKVYAKGFKQGVSCTLAAMDEIMYDTAFCKDTELQKWDSGCWIRYKLYEDVSNSVFERMMKMYRDAGGRTEEVDK